MIGVFDSGIGGLSVLKAIREKAPHLDVVYFGDTENAPYGSKSKREIAHLIAMALRRLHAEGCTKIVAACNSASVSVAAMPIDLLRLNLFEVIEMIEPTVQALKKEVAPIVLLGTIATVRSHMYQEACERVGVSIQALPVPELAGQIERGAPRKQMKEVVCRAVQSALQLGAQTVSLSCTHYPFVRDLFEECAEEAGSKVSFFDPAESVALEVVKRFSETGEGKFRFLISKESPTFRSHVEALFGSVPHTVEVAAPIYHVLKTV